MTSNPNQYYDSFAEELQSRFRRVSKLVSHAPTTGDYHEEIFRTVLRNFLSKRFSVKQGFILAADGTVSSQLDVIVVDEYQAGAYIHQDGDFVIVRPSSVIAVIEVKTSMSATQFDQSLLNIASARKCFRYPSAVVGIIFAYESTEPKVKTLDRWFRRDAAVSLTSDPGLGPTMISFFLQKMMLVRMSAGGDMNVGTDYHRLVHFTQIHPIDEEVKQGWQLKIMLASIYTVCESREIWRTGVLEKESTAQELLLFSGAVPSRDYYSLGLGVSNSSA